MNMLTRFAVILGSGALVFVLQAYYISFGGGYQFSTSAAIGAFITAIAFGAVPSLGSAVALHFYEKWKNNKKQARERTLK